MELFFDTETSGFKNPWIVQFGIILADSNMTYAEFNFLIKANNRRIEHGAYGVHGISTKIANKGGIDEELFIPIFNALLQCADRCVCHNYGFDSRMVEGWLKRSMGYEDVLKDFRRKPHHCTMLETTDLLKLPQRGRRGGYKWPKLQELYFYLFNEHFTGAHDAMADVRATMRCYYELQRRVLNETADINNVDKALDELAQRIK